MQIIKYSFKLNYNKELYVKKNIEKASEKHCLSLSQKVVAPYMGF